MHYTQACAYLDSLQLFKIKLGLEAMESFMASLGSPHTTYPCIHLAGTNGKGSVGAVLTDLLAASGFRVGFYSSPHLTSVRERFRINRTCISKQAFAAVTAELQTALGEDKVTYFEFTTALALYWFRREEVDLAVIETGLGGRLDATNILSPMVSVITSIDIDHQEHLGETIEEIASEKAGIIKPGVPAVIGDLPPAAYKVVKKRCRECNAPLFSYGKDFFNRELPGGRFDYTGITRTILPELKNGLIGAHQSANSALALAVLENVREIFPVEAETVHRTLPKVRWAGRMEPVTVATEWGVRSCLLDGAHNQAGVQALLDTLDTAFPDARVILIWGNMADKDLGDAWYRLLDTAGLIIFTQAETERSAPPEKLAASLQPSRHHRVKTAKTAEEALHIAFTEASGNALIVIAGSLYLVGKIRPLLMAQATTHPD